MNEIIPIHHKVYTLRSKQIILDSDLEEFYKVTICDLKFKTLDTLVNETKKTDETVMGFIRDA